MTLSILSIKVEKEIPFSFSGSHNGAHIIICVMNGSKMVEILKAGAPGFKSNTEAVLTLNFNTTTVDDKHVLDDFECIHHEGLDLFVISSSSDCKFTRVDMALHFK